MWGGLYGYVFFQTVEHFEHVNEKALYKKKNPLLLNGTVLGIVRSYIIATSKKKQKNNNASRNPIELIWQQI